MSRYYEAMKRALEQQAEPRKGQEGASLLPIESAPQAQPPLAIPFDPDATTPVRRDPLDELEDYLHALPAPAAPAVGVTAPLSTFARPSAVPV